MTSREAHSIAEALEGRTRDEVAACLAALLTARPVRATWNPSGDRWWVDVGYCSTEDEARERVCEVIGHVFGQRLARLTAGYVPEPKPVPPVTVGAFEGVTT